MNPTLSIFDDIEITILGESGDIDLAEKTGMALRYSYDIAMQMLCDIMGFPPDFIEQAKAALDG